MRTGVPHFTRTVDGWFRQSAVAPSMRTRQRLIFVTLGILRSGALALRRMTGAQAHLTPRTTCAASYERRLRRALNHPLLTWERSSAPLARQILRPCRARRRVVIIDATAHTEHLRVLTAARRHRGRATPLAWVCRPGQTKQTVSYWRRAVLTQAAQVLPADARVVVVADRACGGPAFTDLVAAHGGAWLAPVHGQPRWRDRRGGIRLIRTQVRRRGDAGTAPGWSSKRRDGGRRAWSRSGGGRSSPRCCASAVCR